MTNLAWEARFETGLDSIDAGYRELVELAARLPAPADGGASSEVLAALRAAAKRLFDSEERQMAECGLDERHRDAHAQGHRLFLDLLGGPVAAAPAVAGAWLAAHALDDNRSMARQMAFVRDGMSAGQAFERAAAGDGLDPMALVGAWRHYAGLLAEANAGLAGAGRRLEAALAQKEDELRRAGDRLEAEQEELTQLLKKVEEAQEQLLQSEKMAAIGQLAAGVAHEINNPIGFVNSNLTTLKSYVDGLLKVIRAYESAIPEDAVQEIAAARRAADLEFLREDLPSLLKESQDGLGRVTKIVQDLKDFSHVDEAERQESDLNAGIESTLNVVWNELKYKAEVIRELGDIPYVTCVPAQINQVFMNLLVNAAQAIEQFGKIYVRSGTENGFVWFEIEDTGKGMSEEVRRRIFEPFFTTKPVGKGTGLGLSISYDIVVKKHGGRLDVLSKPGEGTRFRLWLPLN